MSFKNLAMWGIIVLLSVGLFNMFQNPEKIKSGGLLVEILFNANIIESVGVPSTIHSKLDNLLNLIFLPKLIDLPEADLFFIGATI